VSAPPGRTSHSSATAADNSAVSSPGPGGGRASAAKPVSVSRSSGVRSAPQPQHDAVSHRPLVAHRQRVAQMDDDHADPGPAGWSLMAATERSAEGQGRPGSRERRPEGVDSRFHLVDTQCT
jgi:hypothetical protein